MRIKYACDIIEEKAKARLPTTSDFFRGQIYEVINFFNGNALSFDTKETLELAKIKALAFKSRDEKIDKVYL